MVGCSYGIVYLAFIGRKVLAEENMVYPEIETVLVIGYTDAIARFGKCVLQFLVDLMVCVGDGTVVQVTAQQYLFPF